MKILNSSTGLTYNRLAKNSRGRARSLEKLSSGLRIRMAADDAAGLAIAQKMKAQIRGLGQAQRNLQDGISLIQTAESGLAEIQDPSLQRLRELALQAANDTLTSSDRQQIQQEVQQLVQGIDKIANQTDFNGIKLLNGENPHPGSGTETQGPGNVLSAQPVDANGRFRFATLEGYPTTTLDDNQNLVYGGGFSSHPSVRINGVSYMLESNVAVQTQESNGVYTTKYNVAGVEIAQSVSIVGQYRDKYEIKYEVTNNSGVARNIGFQFHVDVMLGNDDWAPFLVGGNTVSTETAYTGAQIPNQFTVYNQNTGSGGNAEFQAQGILRTTGEFVVLEQPSKFAIGRYNRVAIWDFNPQFPVGDSGYAIWWNERMLNNGQGFTVNTFFGQSVPPTVEPPVEGAEYDLIMQVGANASESFAVRLSDVRAVKLGIDQLVVDPADMALEAVSKLDQALQKVSTERSKFGVYQNALEHILNNVSSYEINLSAAESRISDLDMAKGMMEYSKFAILDQTAQAMLAQGKTDAQSVLQILK